MPFGISSPLPSSLAQECKKVVNILKNFTTVSDKEGGIYSLDTAISPQVFANAKGLCVVTVARMGFLVVGFRGGSGLVLSRLPNGEWSAPSAVSVGGIGGGFELGAELTEFVIIMNNQRAVDSFLKGSNVTFGGNLSVAAGPVGRSVEASASLRSAAALFTYSKTKGLFGGLSLEGSVFAERKGANRKMYGQDVRQRMLLKGEYNQPHEAHLLYELLDELVEEGRNLRYIEVEDENGNVSIKDQSRIGKATSSLKSGASSTGSKISSTAGNISAAAGSAGAAMKRGMTSAGNKVSSASSRSVRRNGEGRDAVVAKPYSRGTQSFTAVRPPQQRTPNPSLKVRSDSEHFAPTDIWSDPQCIAEFDFSAEMECDLSLKVGDKVTILNCDMDDWWEGSLNGKIGIFPANRVKRCE